MKTDRWIRRLGKLVRGFRPSGNGNRVRSLMRSIRRHLDRSRQSMLDATFVPNTFRVFLHPADLERFGPLASALEREMAASLEKEIRQFGYRTTGAIEVILVEDSTVPPGEDRVESRFSETLTASETTSDRETTEHVSLDRSTAVLEPDRATRLRIEGWTLELVSGPECGRRISLGSEPVTLGRGRDARIKLDDPDEFLSRVHARFLAMGEGLQIEDLGSVNGTEIGGRRIDRTVLGEAGEISLGGIRLLASPRDTATLSP